MGVASDLNSWSLRGQHLSYFYDFFFYDLNKPMFICMYSRQALEG